MPNLVTFGNGNSVLYEYSADGKKLRTVHKTGATTLTTDYCGNAVYENGVLKLLLNEAGYVSFPDKKYHFYLRDHQGNTRVVEDKDGNVEETNAYYPFGGTFTSAAGVQPYKYNGKELDAKNGLNWYDYGARQYDAAIGRWHVVDPMSEKYYSLTPYSYCLNNPVKFIDPTGKWIESVWDVFSLATGAKSFVDNVKQGNVGAAIVDGIGVVADGIALALPIIPGGVGATIKGVRAVDKTVDAVKGADKATDVTKTIGKIEDAGQAAKRFDGGLDTKSVSSNGALRNAKDQNGIPRSQQPDKTIKPHTPEGAAANLNNKNVKQYEYTNSKGEKVTIRQDKPATYGQGGKGDQSPHYNAGKNEKLKQHYSYEN